MVPMYRVSTPCHSVSWSIAIAQVEVFFRSGIIERLRITKIFWPESNYCLLGKLRPRQVKWLAQGDLMLVTMGTIKIESPISHFQPQFLFYYPWNLYSFLFLYRKTKDLQGHLMVSLTMNKINGISSLGAQVAIINVIIIIMLLVLHFPQNQWTDTRTIIKCTKMPFTTPQESSRQSFHGPITSFLRSAPSHN